MTKRKAKEALELNVPEDFVGEVIGTVSTGTSEIAPIDIAFGNGDLNILKDKINEIIAKG
jgi:hypothetical protein